MRHRVYYGLLEENPGSHLAGQNLRLRQMPQPRTGRTSRLAPACSPRSPAPLPAARGPGPGGSRGTHPGTQAGKGSWFWRAVPPAPLPHLALCFLIPI